MEGSAPALTIFASVCVLSPGSGVQRCRVPQRWDARTATLRIHRVSTTRCHWSAEAPLTKGTKTSAVLWTKVAGMQASWKNRQCGRRWVTILDSLGMVENLGRSLQARQEDVLFSVVPRRVRVSVGGLYPSSPVVERRRKRTSSP